MHRLSRSALLFAGLVPLIACGEQATVFGSARQAEPGAGMAAGARATTEKPAHRKRRGVPDGTHEGSGSSLLGAHADRDLPKPNEIENFELTGSAKALAVALLVVAAKDRVEDLPALLGESAGWGLPDRREIGRREILDDGGEAFLTALRAAASRFKKAATFSCFPLMPAMETYVATGAEPMWCFFSSDDRLDLLVFKLVAVGGPARIAYVGLFEERPDGRFLMPDADVPPPTRPPPKLRGLEDEGGGPTIMLPEGMQAEVAGSAPQGSGPAD